MVEARSIERDSRPAVLQATIGVFGGLYNSVGAVLAKQIQTGRYAGEWDAPGGGVDAQRTSTMPDERMLFSELARHIEEEVGLIVSSTINWEILTPAILGGGGDWAFPIVVGMVPDPPAKGITRFLTPEDLAEFAERPEGARILSGRGRRMHRIFLRLLTKSPNEQYVQEARRELVYITKQLGMNNP